MFLSSGCLILLDKHEINEFFNITRIIKNFIIIHEGTASEDYSSTYSGHNFGILKKDLKCITKIIKIQKFFTKQLVMEKILNILSIRKNNNLNAY